MHQFVSRRPSAGNDGRAAGFVCVIGRRCLRGLDSPSEQCRTRSTTERFRDQSQAAQRGRDGSRSQSSLAASLAKDFATVQPSGPGPLPDLRASYRTHGSDRTSPGLIGPSGPKGNPGHDRTGRVSPATRSWSSVSSSPAPPTCRDGGSVPACPAGENLLGGGRPRSTRTSRFRSQRHWIPERDAPSGLCSSGAQRSAASARRR